ncbi:MAG: peptide ABC transporter substrate-binding protein [Cellulosilyticaceae bacterium]
MIQKLIKLMICVVIISLIFVGCQQGEENTEEDEHIEHNKDAENNLLTNSMIKTEEKNLLQISMQNPETLHPIFNMEPSVQQNLYLIFDTLVNVEDDGNISPNLAESWSYSEEENSVTLRIRDDVKWHDGQPLQAEDVVFSLKLIQESSESPYKLATKNLANAQALDAQTVKLSYRTVFSGTFQTLFFPVVPKHIYDVPKEQSDKVIPIGSGPYKFISKTPNKEVVLQANPNYFNGKPHIEQIKIMLVPDKNSELHAFEQNLIDVIYTDIMDWGKYTKDKSAEVYEMSTQYYEFIGVNFNNPLFQNPVIREILVYGLNRQQLLNTYYLGHGVITDTPISPNSFLYDQTIGTKEFDKEKAKLLLVQEGYIFDNKTKYFVKNNEPLKFDLLVNKENKERLAVAEGVAKMYKEIGIEVNLDIVDAATYRERIYNKKYETFLGGWKLSYIPDLSFAFHSGQINNGDNFISYRDSKMDELLAQVFNTSPKDAASAYSLLQQYFVEQNPYISLYFRNGALITKKKIKGNIQPTPLNIYTNVERWKVEY